MMDYSLKVKKLQILTGKV